MAEAQTDTTTTTAPAATTTAAPPAATTAAPVATTAAPATTTTAAPDTTTKPAASTDTTDTKPVDGAWRQDWREAWAKGDEKKLSRLSRYASPEAAFDAMVAAQNRIASGELKSALPKDATAEQVAQWRADNGIPEAPEKYDLTFDTGLVIGEADKPVIDAYLKAAHGANMTPAQVKESVKWFYEEQARQAEAVHTATKEAKKATEDALRAEWGQDYRGTRNSIEALLDLKGPMDAQLREKVIGAVDTSPEFARFMAALALEINPATTLVPGASGNIVETMQSEMAEIQKLMGDRNSDYWKGPKADAMQKRYRALVEASEKQKQRAA